MFFAPCRRACRAWLSVLATMASNWAGVAGVGGDRTREGGGRGHTRERDSGGRGRKQMYGRTLGHQGFLRRGGAAGRAACIDRLTGGCPPGGPVAEVLFARPLSPQRDRHRRVLAPPCRAAAHSTQLECPIDIPVLGYVLGVRFDPATLPTSCHSFRSAELDSRRRERIAAPGRRRIGARGGTGRAPPATSGPAGTGTERPAPRQHPLMTGHFNSDQVRAALPGTG